MSGEGFLTAIGVIIAILGVIFNGFQSRSRAQEMAAKQREIAVQHERRLTILEVKVDLMFDVFKRRMTSTDLDKIEGILRASNPNS